MRRQDTGHVPKEIAFSFLTKKTLKIRLIIMKTSHEIAAYCYLGSTCFMDNRHLFHKNKQNCVILDELDLNAL